MVKMILETGQLLSSAHRILEGSPVRKFQVPEPYASQVRAMGYEGPLTKHAHLFPGEKLTFKIHDNVGAPGDKDHVPAHVEWIYQNQLCCALSHAQHPCAKWARASVENYRWLFGLFVALNDEKIWRYGKPHQTFTRYAKLLSNVPPNLTTRGWTDPAQAMPDQYKHADVTIAYKRYYAGEKYQFSKWSKRDVPPWMKRAIVDTWPGDRLQERLDYLAGPSKNKTDITESFAKEALSGLL